MERKIWVLVIFFCLSGLIGCVKKEDGAEDIPLPNIPELEYCVEEFEYDYFANREDHELYLLKDEDIGEDESSYYVLSDCADIFIEEQGVDYVVVGGVKGLEYSIYYLRKHGEPDAMSVSFGLDEDGSLEVGLFDDRICYIYVFGEKIDVGQVKTRLVAIDTQYVGRGYYDLYFEMRNPGGVTFGDLPVVYGFDIGGDTPKLLNVQNVKEFDDKLDRCGLSLRVNIRDNIVYVCGTVKGSVDDHGLQAILGDECVVFGSAGLYVKGKNEPRNIGSNGSALAQIVEFLDGDYAVVSGDRELGLEDPYYYDISVSNFEISMFVFCEKYGVYDISTFYEEFGFEL